MASILWAVLIGYLLGSIPFGLVLTRLGGLGDIRTIGSGNIGATNVLRTGRKGLALATLLLDGLKGTLAVLLVAYVFRKLGHESPLLMVAGGSAILGHLYPVWLKFKGGKGVATGIGVAIGLSPLVGLGMCLTWLVLAAVFRYSSLAAIGAFLLAPIYAARLTNPLLGGFFLAVAFLILWRHRANIRRLLKGEEPKINFSKSTPVATAGVQEKKAN